MSVLEYHEDIKVEVKRKIENLPLIHGITTDGTHLYTSHTTAIYKRDKNGNVIKANDSVLPEGTNHLGDICYWNEKIFGVAEYYESGTHSNHKLIQLSTGTLY